MPQHPVSDSEVLQIRVCISNRFSGEAHAGPRTSAFFFFLAALGLYCSTWAFSGCSA